MAQRDRRIINSTGSTLEPDEIDAGRPIGQAQDPMQVYHHGPGGQVPNPGPSRRGVTEVDGAARVAPHCRPLFDTGTADGIKREGKQFAGDSHGLRLGNEASRFPGDFLQHVDLYGPPPAQAGQDLASTRFAFPHSVVDHTLSSSSSSSGSYLSASSLPSGSTGSVFVQGPPVDSEQMEGVSVDHVATGIASVQLDDVEMDDTETAAANQATENYSVTAETVRLANRLFRQNSEGDMILHLAIIEGVSESMILQIIEIFRRRDLLNHPNNRLQTPLHLATMTRRDDVIVRLLRNGARRRVFNHDLDTPLHIACRQGDVDRVRMLHPATVDQELEQELRVVAESSNKEGQSCLHVAAINNHLNVVQYLVEDCKVNINLKELRRGRTILHLAVEKKNLDLVRYLLNLPDSYELLFEDLTYDHYSALQMALITNQTQIVDLLLLAGAEQIMNVDTR